MEPAFIAAAFVGGLTAMAVRLPPLVGFLLAGFVLNFLGYELTPELETLADLGVTLLLFTIGLKLDVRSLLSREVWGTATAHMAASTLVIAVAVGALKFTGLALLQGTDWTTLLLLGFALSFSSTVFAVKVLEERSEMGSLYGRLAIGVLVMQDIFAVVFITASTGSYPSTWALLLLLLIPAAPLLRRLLDRLGHGEMQVLFGVTAALVLGYALFDLVGIKGDLGVLILGMLLAPAANAAPLAKALFSVKELLLVGFFLSIGLTALPTWETFALALALLLLVPLKGALFTTLFLRFRLRGRTSLLSGLTLSNFSEFGLIVGALAASQGWLSDDWLVVLALTVAMSFIAAAPLNSRGEAVYRVAAPWLNRREHGDLLPSDRPIDIAGAHAVVLGMGRVGRGTYDRLRDAHRMSVVGVEHNPATVERLRAEGYRVVQGDASDSDFWERLTLSSQVELVVLAMPHQRGNLAALDSLRKGDCSAVVAGVVTHADEIDELRRRGADEVFHLYGEAGRALADDAAQRIVGR
ncbi:putative Kef-type K+ transport protein [Nocardiopsis mwathae]|uniref:Putative Kef-type K+ transport protein n=1 Tax=Nocardiopsis mwathae TaxID=1472723 RepID=A0A7W9YIF8_9ACTN|nr:cation:proton antiporter family protein [Nocardiopsis mwathae]MBB6171761.1 putative Kef-type K+ transport protein [Nocardiopsis mwathae]